MKKLFLLFSLLITTFVSKQMSAQCAAPTPIGVFGKTHDDTIIVCTGNYDTMVVYTTPVTLPSGYTRKWYRPNGTQVSGGANLTIYSGALSTNIGRWRVRIEKNTDPTCFREDSFWVINPLTAVTITGPTTVCAGEPIHLSVPNTFVHYQWGRIMSPSSNSYYVGGNLPYFDTITSNNVSWYQYAVEVLDSFGCTASNNIVVTVRKYVNSQSGNITMTTLGTQLNFYSTLLDTTMVVTRQWQCNQGAGWFNLANGSRGITGATSDTVHIRNYLIDSFWNACQFRCITTPVSGTCTYIDTGLPINTNINRERPVTKFTIDTNVCVGEEVKVYWHCPIGPSGNIVQGFPAVFNDTANYFNVWMFGLNQLPVNSYEVTNWETYKTPPLELNSSGAIQQNNYGIGPTNCSSFPYSCTVAPQWMFPLGSYPWFIFGPIQPIPTTIPIPGSSPSGMYEVYKTYAFATKGYYNLRAAVSGPALGVSNVPHQPSSLVKPTIVTVYDTTGSAGTITNPGTVNQGEIVIINDSISPVVPGGTANLVVRWKVVTPQGDTLNFSSTTDSLHLLASETGYYTVVRMCKGFCKKTWSTTSMFEVVASVEPLPVTLTTFDAAWCEPSQKEACLAWSTSTEIDNDKFEIERATSTVGNFTKIGEVKGAGNTSSPQYYHFEDANTGDENYYRLKQIDNDGDFEYHHTVALMRDREQKLVINFNSGTSLLTLQTPTATTATILNAIGELVLDIQVDAHKEVSLASLPTGLYIVSMENKVQKIVIK